MKNAMKRIMSILLVALLLVSALPLAASADALDGFGSVTPDAPQQSSVDALDAGDDDDKTTVNEDKTTNTVNEDTVTYTDATGAYIGGFHEIEFARGNGDTIVTRRWENTTGGPDELTAKEMLDTLLTAYLGHAWTEDYEFRKVTDEAGTTTITTDINDEIEESEDKIKVVLYKIPRYNITAHLMQNTPNGAALLKTDTTLKQQKVLSYDKLKALIPAADTNYNYRLEEIVYNNNTIRKGQNNVPIKVDADGTVYKEVYIYVDVIDTATNYPVNDSVSSGNSNFTDVKPDGGSGNGGGTNNDNTVVDRPNYRPNDTVSGSDLYLGYSGNIDKTNIHDVVLYVYLQGKGSVSYDKAYTINGLASNGTVSKSGIYNYLKSYYTFSGSDSGNVDGLYMHQGNFISTWSRDVNRYDKIHNLDEARNDGEIQIAVVLSNAKRKTTSSSSNADSTNPKTGDPILVPIAVLTISATALAATMYVYSKKRVAR